MNAENEKTKTFFDLHSKEETNTSGKWWNIDQKMVPYKLHFFFLTGAFGAVNPFISAFVLKQLKFSATSFATVVLAMNIGQSLAKPIVCFIIDYFNKLKTVLCILGICEILASLAIFSIPQLTSNTSNDEGKGNSSSYSGSWLMCEEPVNTSWCQVRWNEPMKSESNHNMNPSGVVSDMSLNDFNLIWCQSGVNNQMWNAFNNVDVFSLCCIKSENFTILNEPSGYSSLRMQIKSSLYHNKVSFLRIICLSSSNAFNTSDNDSNCNTFPSFSIRCYNTSEPNLEAEIPSNVPSSDLKFCLFSEVRHLTMDRNSSFRNVSSVPCSIWFNYTDRPHECPVIECGLSGGNVSSYCFNSTSSASCSIWFNCTDIPHAFKVIECGLCGSNASSSCFKRTYGVNSSLRTGHGMLRSDFESYRFWLFAIAAVLHFICWGCLLVLSETVCCENVQKHGSDYGKQRLFGAVGFGLMSGLAGLICQYTDSYLSVCPIVAVMCIAMLWNFSRMDFEKPDFSSTYCKDIGDTFRSRDFVAFAIGALLNGIGVGIVLNYLVWFLTTIGGNDALSGLVYAVQNLLGELPFMFFSGWFIQKLGYFYVTTISLLSHFVQFFFLSYLHSPWYVLLIEWTPGWYFGIYYVAVVGFAKKNAKPGTEATMQGILFVLFDGVGTAIGNVLAGISMDYFGGHLTFFYAAICFGSFTLISFIYAQFCQETVHSCKATSKMYEINT